MTQEQWEAVMGNNPSHFKGPKNPVDDVSWEDCQQFLGKLNAKVGAGQESSSCRPRRSGNTPAGQGARRGIALGTMKRKLGEYAWYEQELGQQDASCRREEAERLGAIRHARKRVGVVSGLVE